MIEQSWIYGLLGGLMIGTAAAVLLLFNGRIMGASGLIGGVVDGTGWNSLKERLAFLAGLAGVPALIALGGAAPDTHLTSNLGLVIIAGLAVGFGTRMANGCTSGHGVCGISRFSMRGIVATLIYLAAGAAAMFATRHLLGVI